MTEPWFLVLPFRWKQMLIDRYGSVEEGVRRHSLVGGHCIGVEFAGGWTEPGEKYLWDGTQVEEEQ